MSLTAQTHCVAPLLLPWESLAPLNSLTGRELISRTRNTRCSVKGQNTNTSSGTLWEHKNMIAHPVCSAPGIWQALAVQLVQEDPSWRRKVCI